MRSFRIVRGMVCCNPVIARLVEEKLEDEGEDSESSTEEDENGDLLTPAKDLRILETLAAIRSKDPAIYSGKKFFDDGLTLLPAKSFVVHRFTTEHEDDDEGDAGEGDKTERTGETERAKKSKPLTYGQFLHTQLYNPDKPFAIEDEPVRPLSMDYSTEQRQLRAEFLKEAAKACPHLLPPSLFLHFSRTFPARLLSPHT